MNDFLHNFTEFTLEGFRIRLSLSNVLECLTLELSKDFYIDDKKDTLHTTQAIPLAEVESAKSSKDALVLLHLNNMRKMLLRELDKHAQQE